MTEWLVRFEVNGGEYSSSLVIKAKTVKQLGPRVVMADYVIISVDEDIEKVEKL